jgi:hypothetical protein
MRSSAKEGKMFITSSQSKALLWAKLLKSRNSGEERPDSQRKLSA